MWLQRIQTVLTAIQAIRTASLVAGATVNPVGAFFGGIFGGARANGGPVDARKSYLVGERGPEIFSPIRSGYITPNGQARTSLSKSSSVTHNHNWGAITVNLASGSPAEARRAAAIVTDDILSRIRGTEGEIRDAEYTGATA